MLEEVEHIKKDLQEYIELKLDLLKLQAAENVSRIISGVVVGAIIAIFAALILFFLSFAAGFFLASILNSTELGFLCVAGFYLLLVLILLLFRKKIIDRPVIRSVINIFFPKNGENEKS